MALRTDRRCGAIDSIPFRVSAKITELAGIEAYDLQPWRTKESPLHSDSNRICIRNGIWIKDPNYYEKHGELPRLKACRRKLHQVPYGHKAAMCGTTGTGVDENSDGIMLAGFGSLLTKILFSFRSTEVYGILIVMKIPTERSRSWGLRSGSWPLIGVVREVCIYLHSPLGSMHWGASQDDSIVLTLMG